MSASDPNGTGDGVPDDLGLMESLPDIYSDEIGWAEALGAKPGQHEAAGSRAEPSDSTSDEVEEGHCPLPVVEEPHNEHAPPAEAESGEKVDTGALLLNKLSEMLSADMSDLTIEDGLRGRPPLLDSFDVEGIASLIQQGNAKKIVVMCGAGISVSAGIPDFRTPGTGLYDNLQKYDLPHPQAVFDIDYFREKPEPFYLLAKELFPGGFSPTPTHHFIKLLHDKGLLLRCFTQNIDSLESQAGLPASSLVAAHGNFDSASCIDCGCKYSQAFAKEAVDAGVPPKCTKCGSLVKPDIVFFGEALPGRFGQCAYTDLPTSDLLIVMGTSLQVQPFASLVDMVEDECPRLLINRERVGEASPSSLFSARADGFNFGDGNYRDALFLGNCDDGVKKLAHLLGWGEELQALMQGSPH